MNDPERKEPSFGLPGRSRASPAPKAQPPLAPELRARVPEAAARGAATAGRRRRPLAGLLPLLLAGLLLAAVGLAALVELEQVASGPGIVRPFGEVRVVEPPVDGRVGRLYVREGDLVNAGAPLVELDREPVERGVAALQGELDRLEAAILRLEAEATQSEPQFPPALVEATPEAVEAEINLYNARRNALEERLSAARRTLAERRRSAQDREQHVGEVSDRLQFLRDQASALAPLAERGYYPAVRYQSILDELSQSAAELAEARSAQAAAAVALQQAESGLLVQDRAWQNQVLDELAGALDERETARARLDRQRATLRDLVLRAPVDGVVAELAVTGSGQAVSTAQPLMTVVPTGDSLLVDARLRGEGAGPVEVGMPATIRIEALDAARDATLSGRIERAAAVLDEATGRSVYEVGVRSEETALRGPGGRALAVLPGMAARVEVRVGERTVLDLLIERLRRAGGTILGRI